MHRNQSVSQHQFAMVPKAEIPRSRFDRQFTHKTAFDAGYLVPIYVDEVLPGDSFNLKATIFARMATPLYPIMDNLHVDTFFFFVPNRLLWANWPKFMGEQANPDDTTTYVVPMLTSPAGGYDIGSVFDYMGLPVKGQLDAAGTITHSVLHLRAYNLIWNEWFRDQNMQYKCPRRVEDGGDVLADFALCKRGKRHDYFTSCLPWTQKGNTVLLPLGGSAPVRGIGVEAGNVFNVTGLTMHETGAIISNPAKATNTATNTAPNQSFIAEDPDNPGYPYIYADLAEATAATINQLRQAFQIQKLLERDARGGTRYTEIIRAHFGVVSPDARLQRPEYLGGGSTFVNINPVAQTSGTGTYTDTPQGNLSAFGTALAHGHGFSASFTEHGVIIGLACVRGDLTYQQGLERMWSRSTRYDFYFPAFANLGEQAVLNKEIYCKGTAQDEDVFGYQERWAEYRYKPSQITGQFRSCAPQTLDAWHLAQNFTTLPVLNNAFIQEAPPMERVLAVGSAAQGQHFLVDCFFDNKVTRPMPLYSVPGLIDHF